MVRHGIRDNSYQLNWPKRGLIRTKKQMNQKKSTQQTSCSCASTKQEPAPYSGERVGNDFERGLLGLGWLGFFSRLCLGRIGRDGSQFDPFQNGFLSGVALALAQFNDPSIAATA